MTRFSAALCLCLVLAVSAGAQQTPWQWVNPLPQGNPLNGIWALNQDTTVAVGDVGTIIKTTNGGETWQVQQSVAGITDQLFAVQFVNNTLGYAVGEVGWILRTTDGGATWAPQANSSVSDLFAISFISPTVGWVSGSNGTILKTTNGGASWVAESTGTTAGLYGLTFLSSTTGWVVGTNGVILATTDGGTSWHAQSSGTTQSLYGVQFLTPYVGFAVGSFGIIIRTINGGGTWTPQVSGTDLSLYALQFNSSFAGWAIGSYGTILKTTNSGISWFVQTTPTYNDLFAARFVSATNGFAVGDFGTILATTDGGTTWVSQSSAVKDNLNGVRFLTTSNGWGAGDEGTIVQTADGGLSWTPRPSGVFQNLYDVIFLSAAQGWVVGDSAMILKTTNGGASWFQQNSHSDPTFYSITFATSTTGWTVGDFGSIFRTTNGGSSWVPETSHTFLSLLKVQFADANTGWAVGYNGVVVKTTNGGATWTQQASGTGNSLSSLAVVDANHVYAVGDFGTVLATTNGGASWSTRATHTLASFYAAVFTSASTGWIAGDDGTILATSDGGTTWQTQNSGTQNTLVNLQFISTGSGGGVLYASGIGGTLICSGITPLPVRIWTGGYDSLWTSAGNWSPLGVPDKTDSVVVLPASRQPILSSVTQQMNIAGLRVAAGARLTITNGLAQLIVKNNVTVEGTLTIDPSSTIGITAGGDFYVSPGGSFSPGGSTVILGGSGRVRGSFNNLYVADGASSTSLGNISVGKNITTLGDLVLRQVDTLTVLTSDPLAVQGPGLISGGTIKRAIRPGETGDYRFESAVTTLRFYPVGTPPDTVSMTVYPNTLPPGVPDSLFVKRYYTITPSGGSNYLAALSLRYDSTETAITIDNLALFRDSSGIFFNMGASDFTDSDLVAIELDSIRSLSTWCIGRADYLPVNPLQFLDSLIVRDNGAGVDTLAFGTMAGATDGIDTALGEAALGPRPPAGTFDARWSIPSTNGSLVDLRDILSFTHQTNTYTCVFQPGPAGYPMTLRWNQSVFPVGTVVLQDQATAGGQFSIDMKKQSSFTITNASIGAVQIVYRAPRYYAFAQGWNMVSLPLMASDGAKKSRLFPTAVSNAFGYSGTYFIADTLVNGIGYWLKFPSPQNVGIDGLTLSRDTIALHDGWNMIGSVSSPVSVGQIVASPGNLLQSSFFTYVTGYVAADSIRPSKGYWVKAAGSGTIILASSPAGTPKIATAAPGDGLQSFNTLTVTDHAGNHQLLYFRLGADPSTLLDRYELPPPPPEGAFDARFSTNRLAEIIADPGASLVIDAQSSHYPLKLTWHLVQPSVPGITLKAAGSGAPLQHARASADGSISIADESVRRITVTAQPAAGIPKAFALMQNYPNPFNPSTEISFDLPVPASVTLKVFDILGKEVTALAVNRNFAAGHQSVNFNAGSLASGVYFYRLIASAPGGKEFRSVRKMLLVR